MGTLKQTLPWPTAVSHSTIVSSAFDAIADISTRMFVVVGSGAAMVIDALGTRMFTRVDADSNAEMFESIRAGLRAVVAAERDDQAAFDAVLLQPGDHPEVERTTLEALLRRFGTDPGLAVMPALAGKGGHPVLIPRGLIGSVLDYSGQGGLKQFWRLHPERCIRLSVPDQGCVLDVDSPTAYFDGVKGHESG
jgi:CTP:molybdopterin cytidylyltransferase MocA